MSHSPHPRRRVVVIGTGGTFAMAGRHGYDWIDYADSGIIRGLDDILPELDPGLDHIEIEPLQHVMLGSTAITANDWLDLGRIIAALNRIDSPPDGIVVTHGTASLEETAWFLDLTVGDGVPVVLVGAQRPPNTVGSDAAGNLRAALATAADPASHGLGALVAMDQYIFAARDVTKTSNAALNAFQAWEFGPLARVEADASITWRRRPHRSSRPDYLAHALAAEQLPRVDIAFSHAGADGVAIRAYVEAGAQAIISAGMPPGRCTPGERAALLQAVQSNIVVVQASRAVTGAVPRQRYNEVDGILAGGDLAPQKLRVLMQLALSQTTDRAELQRLILAI